MLKVSLPFFLAGEIDSESAKELADANTRAATQRRVSAGPKWERTSPIVVRQDVGLLMNERDRVGEEELEAFWGPLGDGGSSTSLYQKSRRST